MQPSRIHRPYAAVRRFLALAALLLLGGCVLDPVPEWDLSFFGEVRRADTGAPVPGAQVLIRLAHPEDPDPDPDAPTLQGTTDANGQFDLRIHERTRATPPHATLIVTPPAGSGLAPRTVGGRVQDVFTRISRTGRDVSYDAVVELAPQ